MNINSKHRLLSNALSGLKTFLFAATLAAVAHGAVESREARSSSLRFESRPWAEEVYNAASACDSIIIEGGRLQENTTWAPPKTHLVFNSVYVPKNITLTIITNSVVKFCEGTFIKVEDGGKLNIVGSEEENVVLTAANDNTIGTTVPGLDPDETLVFKGIILQSSSATFTDNGWVETRGFNFGSYPNLTIRDLIAFRSNGLAIIPISVSGTRNQSFMIDWEAIDGTATFSNDYTLASGSITWTSTSDSEKSIQIPLVTNHITGTNTSFTVRIKAARGANILQGTSVVTIKELTSLNIDSDSKESEAIRFESRPWAEAVFNATSTNDNIIIEGGRLKANTTWNPPETHLVFNTVYIPNGITLTINAGTIVKFCEGTCIKVEDGGKLNIVGAEGEDVILTAANDNIVGAIIPGLNPEETIEFSGIVLSSSSATFTDNSWLQTRGFKISTFPNISIGDIEVFRTMGTASILVSVSGTRNQSFSIEWVAIDGTATLSNDYTLASGSLTWTKTGDGNKNIEIPLVVDRNAGTNTNFKVRIATARGCNVNRGETTVTIKELDTLNIDSAYEESEPIRFESRDWAEAVFNAASTNENIIIEGGRLKANTAWNPPETHLVFNTVYVPSGITLTINANTIVKFCEGTCIKVEDGGKLNIIGAEDEDVIFTAANDDTVGETIGGIDSEEEIVFKGIVLSSSNATLTDNGWLETRGFSVSNYPTLTLYAATANRNSGKIFLPIILSGSTRSQSFSIDWEAIDGTATLSNDFTVAGGRITWANTSAGNKNIEIPIVIDHKVGSNTTFTVRLKALRGANATNREVTATIAEFKTGQLTPETIVEMADSAPSNETAVNEGILLQQILLNDVEHIQYSGKWQNYNKDDAAALRVTIESDNGVTVLKEGTPNETGHVDIRPADLEVGFYTLKHEILNAQGDVLATMKKTFSITDPEKVALHGGTLTQNETWTPDKIHVVYATVYVPTIYTLFIEPGTIVKFMAGTGIELLGGGAFFANGIIFTNIEDDTVGGDTMNDGYTDRPTVDTYFLKGNFHFSGDTELRNITHTEPLTGRIESEKMLARGSIYRVSGTLQIVNGGSLTILPGTIIKMEQGAGITIGEGCSLNACGTHAAPIIITSIKDDSFGGDTNKDGNSTNPQPGDWKNITINGKGNANFEYTSILYSGNGQADTLVPGDGSILFNNSILAHTFGIGVNYGSFAMTNSIFRDVYIGFRHHNCTCVNSVFYDMTYLSNNGGETFKNCIIANYATAICWFSGDSGCTFENCVLWNPAGFGPQNIERTGTNGNIWGDPLFVDAENGDFRIVEGSPCVDRANTEIAPNLDYFCQPRITITGQGTNVVGHLADIGVCEVMPRNVASDVDLIPQSISSVTNAIPGQLIFIKWEIANVGGTDVTGSWRDTIFLVSDTNSEVELGEKVTTSTVVAGGSVFCSGYFVLPAISEGNWYPKVNVNSYHDIFEGNLIANNALIGDRKITLTCEEIDASIANNGIAFAGIQNVVKLKFNEGDENRMVTFNLPKGVRITWGFGSMPTSGMSYPGLMGSVTANGNNPVKFCVPEGVDEVYIILETDKTTDYDFYTDTTTLSIMGVEPNILPSNGITSFTIFGAGFGITNVVYIINDIGNTVITNVIQGIDNGLVATVDCSKLTPGKCCDIKVESDDREATLENAITVSDVEGKGVLDFEYSMPSVGRAGRAFTVVVKYRNNGNKDISCPLITLSDRGRDENYPVEFSVDGINFKRGNIQLIGIDANGAFNGLHPGDAATQNVIARIPGKNNNTAAVAVRVNSESDAMAKYTTEIDRYVTPKTREEYASSEDEYYRLRGEYLQLLFGANNGEMIRSFGKLANQYYYSNGEKLQEIDDLISFGLAGFNNQSDENPKPSNQVSDRRAGAYLYPDYDYLTSDFDLSNERKIAVIAHGLNDGLFDSSWMSEIAESLSKEGYCVICINWSIEASPTNFENVKKAAQLAITSAKYSAKAGGFWGGAAGGIAGGVLGMLRAVSSHIPEVCNIAIQQLKDSKINPSYTVFIGHSFGSHLLGYMARNLGIKVDRHIGLDTAAEIAVADGNEVKKGDAKVTEYYRSSSGSGRNDAYADYNYLICKKGSFDLIQIFRLDMFFENHSYSHKWFIENLKSGFARNSGLGFWRDDSVNSGEMLANKGGYLGVIYGPMNKLENIQPYRDGKDPDKIHYPGNQFGWLDMRRNWISSHDLSLTKDNISPIDGINFKTGFNRRWDVTVKDKCDVETVDRDFKLFELTVSLSDLDGSNSKEVYSAIRSTPDFNCDIKIQDDMISNESEMKKLTFRTEMVYPFAIGDGVEYYSYGTEIYNEDNSIDYDVLVEKGEGPEAVINGHRNNQFTLYRPVRFAKEEDYINARESGETFVYIYDGSHSQAKDGRKIEHYFWYDDNPDGPASEKSVFRKEYLKGVESYYPIRLLVLDDNNNEDVLEGQLYVYPVFGEGDPIDQVQSGDPNEMNGPIGVGDPETERFIKPGEWLTYTVYFENTSNATAAAQEVYVTNELDKWLDWSTFEMGEIVYNNKVDLSLAGVHAGTCETAVEGTNYNVKTSLEFDDKKGVAKWYMRIVDPATETGWPEDILIGFLPPNDATYRGEGHLTYRVRLREDAPAGTRINNSATIVFDYNEPIETEPAWWNTVAKMHMVEFDGGATNVNLVVGAEYGELPSPANREGKTFVGWFTEPGGAGREITRETIVSEDDGPLYAYWTENAYTVNYLPNGGEGEVESQSVTYESEFSLRANEFTYKSHKFTGWATSEGGDAVYAAGQVVSNLTAVANGVIDLYAAWEEWTTEVRFVSLETETNLTYVVEQPFETLPEVDERLGWTFGGWFTGEDGSGDLVTAETVVSDGAGPLYAYWIANEYTVNYLPNGGEGVMESLNTVYDESFALSSNEFTRTSYQFVGWGTNDTDAVYAEGQVVSNLTAEANGSVDLFAVWELWTTEVRFVSLGTETNLTFVVEQPYGQLPSFEASEGWTFLGWFTEPNGEGQEVTEETLVDANVETLYAHWHHDVVVLSVNCLQAWPLDRRVIINYTLAGRTNETLSVYSVKFYGTVDGGETFFELGERGEISRDGATGIVLGEGEHKTLWMPDETLYDVRIEDMQIKVVAEDVTEAATYLILDLESNKMRTDSEGPVLTNDVCRTSELWLRRIEPGSFVMGSPSDELGRNDNEVLHEVKLTGAYYIGVFETTQKQYETIMGSNPSVRSGLALPVENVSYEALRGSVFGSKWPLNGKVDKFSFFFALREKTGNSLWFDLPTEAQWEYACRAGYNTAFGDGSNITNSYVDGSLDKLGWYAHNSYNEELGTNSLQRVGTRLPNDWGLYDMHGNVFEWCLDWFGNYNTNAVVEPRGADGGFYRVLKGGSWQYYAYYCRSGYHRNEYPNKSDNNSGFRIILLKP